MVASCAVRPRFIEAGAPGDSGSGSGEPASPLLSPVSEQPGAAPGQATPTNGAARARVAGTLRRGWRCLARALRPAPQVSYESGYLTLIPLSGALRASRGEQ